MYRLIRALAALILVAGLTAAGLTWGSRSANAQVEPRTQAGFSTHLDHVDSTSAFITWSGSLPPLGVATFPPIPTGVFDVIQDGTTILFKSHLSGTTLGGTVTLGLDKITSHTITLAYEGDSHYLPWASDPMSRNPYVPLSVNWLAANPKTSNYKPALIASLSTPANDVNLNNLPVGLLVDGTKHSKETSFASSLLTNGAPGVMFPYNDLVPGTHTYQAVFDDPSPIFMTAASTSITLDIPSTPPLQSTFSGTSYHFDELSTNTGPAPFDRAPYIKFHVTALHSAPNPAGMQAFIYVDRAPSGYTTVDNNGNAQFWSGAGFVDTHTYSLLVSDTMSQQVQRSLTKGTAYITSHLQKAGGAITLSWTRSSGESPCCSNLPTGVISVVEDGSVVLAAFPANYDGSYELTNAQVTDHYVQVVYGGDANFLPFTSSPYAKTPFVEVTAGWRATSLTAVDKDVALVAKFDASDLTPYLSGWASLIVDGQPIGVFVPVTVAPDGSVSATFAGSGPDTHTVGSRGDSAGPILWGNHTYQVAYTSDYPTPGPNYVSPNLAFGSTTSSAIDVNYNPSGTTTTTSTTVAPTTTAVDPTTTTTTAPTTTNLS